MTWKTTTASQLKQYYQNEFPEYIPEIPAFIRESKSKQIGIAFPEAHPVEGERIPAKDFVRRPLFDSDEPYRNNSIDQWRGENSIVEFVQSPGSNDPIEGKHALASPELIDQPSIPEAVYYAVDFYDRNWALVVDIDAKDVALEWAKQQLSTAQNKTNEEIKRKAGVFEAAPEGYPYRFDDIDRAVEYGFEVKEFFRDNLASTATQAVYSGQGCHVYLHDEDPMYRYGEQNRELITHHLIHELGIPIDKPVTTDPSRVMRLPYSLHADVSRVVTPISSPDFDYREEAKPQFLTDADAPLSDSQ
ncbi:hypothetical protein [Haloarcula sp. 1CSR25-25]|jgi:DNA primase catalytic subunit|uniref:hypothetical protein n=1 Tax=Haloarcula sp. 1CSR25-25 TaxID=2862545 RepID=UPI002893C2D5|nr:hypothetical protein [Haloarcula sp. 1CSR25-25]MDT3437797.1 hypothetical protein [Haloarcula sp. 1CSR25-25]